LRDKNQTLVILFTALEDEGYYVCNASNKVGSAVSTKTLYLIGMITKYNILYSFINKKVITVNLNNYKMYLRPYIFQLSSIFLCN